MKEAVIKLQIESLEQQLKVLKSKIVSKKEKRPYLIYMEFLRVRWICL